MIENDLRNSGLIKGNRTAGRKPTGGWTQLINQQYFFIDINLI